MKVAIVISHPIQHFSPQYASLAAHPSLQVKVFFASALGYRSYVDPNFKQQISWNNLYLDEFDHVFLNGEEPIPADKDLDAENLDQALTEFAPDLVMLHGYFQKFQRRAHNWAKRNKVKTAYTADSERRQKRSPLKELLKYPVLYKYFAGIDIFLSVGPANEAYYRFYGVPPRKIVRMHFSIDLRSYEQAYANRRQLAAAVREKHDLHTGDSVFSVVGKLVPWKNQIDIIDAMIQLEQQGLVSNLFVIGSGDQMESLKQKAAALTRSKVIFPGFVKPEDLPGYYAASDIYIHPAAIEPHSLAISEAIYMGAPVILSDRCGSYGEDDDVQEGKNGFVFPCGNIAALAEKIRILLGDTEKRRTFGEYSHRIADRFQRRSHGGFVNEMIEKIK